MALSFWPGFPLWRELYHPGERRWWRCRPTYRGVELGFREDGEAEWGSRIIDRAPPLRDDWSDTTARDRAEEQAVVHARPRLAEQLSDGFVERSREPGAQLWDLLPDLWREASPGFDPDPLVREQAACEEPAISEVATWLAIAGASEVPPEKRWWPAAIGETEQAAARAALIQHADRILPALVLALRHPERSGMIAVRDALAVARASDAAWLFDGLVDRQLHQAPGRGELGIGLTRVTARICPITDERVARLRALVMRAPATSDESPSRYLAHRAGMELALVLAEWAADPRAAAALRSSVHDETRAVTAWAVLKAAEVAPSPEWREALRCVRPLMGRLGEKYRAAVDTAIAACS